MSGFEINGSVRRPPCVLSLRERDSNSAFRFLLGADLGADTGLDTLEGSLEVAGLYLGAAVQAGPRYHAHACLHKLQGLRLHISFSLLPSVQVRVFRADTLGIAKIPHFKKDSLNDFSLV